jgi:hypothetical protein
VRISRVIVLAIGSLLIFAASILGYRNHVRSVTYSLALETVRAGDTKEKVVELFGNSPDAITNCSDPHKIFQDGCREVYWYYSFLERWEIYFDHHGKVLAKGHEVSF